jgi:nucleoid-associated protein YgaU
MAKPNPQANHGQASGSSNESALSNGEAPRRGAEAGADQSADWGLPKSKEHTSVRLSHALLLIVVLLGVFGFVTYKKWGHLQLHPEELAGTQKGDAPADAKPDASAPAPGSTLPPAASTAAAAADPFQTADDVGGARNGAQSQASLAQAKPVETERQPAQQNLFGDLSSGRASEQPANGNPMAGTSNAKSAAGLTPDAVRTGNPSPGDKPIQPGASAVASARSPFDSDEPRPDASKSQNMASRLPTMADASAGVGMGNSVQQPNPQQPGLTPRVVGQNAAAQMAPAQVALAQSTPAQSTLSQSVPPQSEPGQSEPVTLLDEQPKDAAFGKTSGRPRMGNAPSAEGSFESSGIPRQQQPPAVASQGASSPMASLDSEQPSNLGRTTIHSVEASSSSTRAAEAAVTPPNEGMQSSEDAFASRPSPAGTTAAPSGQEQLADANPGAGVGVVAAGASDDSYIVSPQDNFWTISRKKYGTSRYFLALAEVNKARIPNPTRMRPGMKVITPPAALLEAQYAPLLPKGTAVRVPGAPDAPPSRGAGFFVGPAGQPMYRTGESDTLSSIAEKHLGRSSRSMQIFALNRDKLSNPNHLKPGIDLELPGDASNVVLLDQNDDRR